LEPGRQLTRDTLGLKTMPMPTLIAIAVTVFLTGCASRIPTISSDFQIPTTSTRAQNSGQIAILSCKNPGYAIIRVDESATLQIETDRWVDLPLYGDLLFRRIRYNGYPRPDGVPTYDYEVGS